MSGIAFGLGRFERPTIASVATCDLATVEDHHVEITGSVPITSFGSTAYLWKECYATVGFTLTNNAAIITGTGANISVEAGDTFSVLANASGVFSVIDYKRASGKALVAPTAVELGLAIGTNVQAFDSDLSALAGLNIDADTLPYGNGPHTMALTAFTSFARSLLDDVSFAAMRATLSAAATIDVQLITTSTNWVKPATVTASSRTMLIMQGHGGPSGGGARVTSGNPCSGGSGGGGGERIVDYIPTSTLGATEAAVVGSVGVAGLGATVDNTAGGNGTAPGNITFGTNYTAFPGGAGAGGQLAGNSGGGGGAGLLGVGGSSTGAAAGAAGNTGGVAGGTGAVGAINTSSVGGGSGAGGTNGAAGALGGSALGAGPGGGAGGGIAAAPTAFAGGQGGRTIGTPVSLGGAIATNGTSPASVAGQPGSAGSGAGSNLAGNGGIGGAGANGAGGGGGGSAIGGNGGDGNLGGPGFVLAITWS